MNAAHLHLMLNHLPLAAVLFALLILLYALWRPHVHVVGVALWLAVFAGLSAIPVLLSGEGAEEILEQLAGIDHNRIHTHEEAAETAFWFLQMASGFALLSLGWIYYRQQLPRWLVWVNLLMQLAILLMLAQVNNTGGQIRHPEIAALYGSASAAGMPATQRSI